MSVNLIITILVFVIAVLFYINLKCIQRNHELYLSICKLIDAFDYHAVENLKTQKAILQTQNLTCRWAELMTKQKEVRETDETDY